MENIVIMGNAGQDAEMRYLDSGQHLCQFSVAVNSKKRGEEVTRWYRVTAWGALALTCSDYVRKGMTVGVAGRFSVDDWVGKDGSNRYTLEINANDVRFLSYPQEDGDGGEGYGGGGYGAGGYE